MKNLTKLSFLFMLLGLLLISCGEDDPCEVIDCNTGTCVEGICECPDGFTGINCDICEDLTKSILGTWTTTNIGGETGEITFESDGTMIDNDCLILEYENGGVVGTLKSWELDGDDITFYNMIDPALGSGTASANGTIASFDCNQITVNFGGLFSITFNRN